MNFSRFIQLVVYNLNIFDYLTPNNMPYPLSLYYSQPISRIAYSDFPTNGLFNIERFLHGLPCWESISYEQILKPKIVILADWSASSWSEDKILRVQNELKKMIEQGFTIYLSQNNSIIPLSEAALSALTQRETRQKIRLIDHSEIISVAALEYKIPRDHLYILDDYTLRHLLHDELSKERYIWVSDLDALNLSREHLYEAVDKLKTLMPTPKRIVLDIFNSKQEALAADLARRYPDIPLLIMYRDVVIGESEAISLIRSGSAGTLGLELTRDALQSVTTFTVREAITPSILAQISALAPSLEVLDLRGSLGNSEYQALDGFSFHELKHLSITDCSLPAGTLSAVIKGTTTLRMLDLSAVKLSEPDFHLGDLPLAHLEILNLSTFDLSGPLFYALIEQIPELKVLKLSYCINMPQDFSLPNSALNNLEHLIICSDDEIGLTLQYFIAHSPRLQMIDLSNCNVFLGGLDLGHLDLVCMRSLSLARTDVPSDSLNALLRRMPNLTKLNLSFCIEVWDGFDLSDIKLDGLMSLNLDGADTPLIALKDLLRHISKLEVLNLANYDQLDHAEDLDEFNFSTLKTLILDNCTLKPETLKRILKAAPNLAFLSLEKITLSGMKSEDDIDEELHTLLQRVGVVNLSLHKGFTWQHIEPREASQPLSPEDLIFDPAEFMNIQNPMLRGSEPPFRYAGTNATKNQDMIIEKLSQYLTLMQQHDVAEIPRLTPGICLALTQLFKDLSIVQWSEKIDAIASWNGTIATLNASLGSIFSELFDYVQKYQLAPSQPASYFIGNRLNFFLSNIESPCILESPWHAIAVRKKEGGMLWEVYDPNFVNGYKEVPHDVLLKTIHDSLGTVVSVRVERLTLEPQINDKHSFIENGGLLALTSSANKQEILRLLTEVSQRHNPHLFFPATQSNQTVNRYTKEALTGLLLRDVRGVPSWIIGIQTNEICEFTFSLLKQFISEYHEDYGVQLQKSMACLEAEIRHECITKLTQLRSRLSAKDSAAWSNVFDSLIEVLRNTPRPAAQYAQQLITWQISTIKTQKVDEYCQALLKPDSPKNCLIYLNSAAGVSALAFKLQHYAKSTSCPVFYIDSPDDLICSSRSIQRQADGTGVFCEPPGGALYDFLQANQCNKVLLIVNFDHFSMSDLTRFRALFGDNERAADGVSLSDSVLVRGFINQNNPLASELTDLISDCKREFCPIADELIIQYLPPIPKAAQDTDAGYTPINLYKSPEWRRLLMGRWIYHDESLVYEEGALAKALAEGARIEIQNGLWDDEDFCHFWRQQSQERPIELLQSNGYNWGSLTGNIATIHQGVLPSATVLNRGYLNRFYRNYKFEQGLPVLTSGLIEQNANQTLAINLTSALTEDEWASLLDACQKYHVLLEIHLSPGVALPEPMRTGKVKEAASVAAAASISDLHFAEEAWVYDSAITSAVVSSTDPSSTIAQIIAADSDWVVIDISECTPADLFRPIDRTPIAGSNPPRYLFSEKPSVLDLNRKVLLTGTFSQALVDELAPLVIAQQNATNASGSLILVGSDLSAFNYCPVFSHQVTADEKALLLPEATHTALRPYLEKESLNRLKARAVFLQREGQGVSCDAALTGLKFLDARTLHLGPPNLEGSEDAANTLTQERRRAIATQLALSPMIFLAGLSGTGKSTFVVNELCQSGESLYLGEESIERWARDGSPGRKYLFIDEANLSARSWSEFEGIFNNPPTLFINGVLHNLSPDHKVIFAGNPLSDGAGRSLAPLFEEHVNTLVFTPLSHAFIYEKILKPVFSNSSLEGLEQRISNYILKVYQFLCSCSTTNVLISPRELQMIALLIRNEFIRGNDLGRLDEYTRMTAYHIAAPLVPINKREGFDAEFKPTLSAPKEPSVTGSFVFTPSRQDIQSKINSFLALHEHRWTLTEANEAIKFGGLGGLLLEGASGSAASELVIATLVARGYQEVHETSRSVVSERSFYRVTENMSFAKRRDIFIRAFNEGAVVVIDEMNRAPMMERFMNKLLMGEHPDGGVTLRPDKPGFMIIATQSPITSSGVDKASTPLLRRLSLIDVPEYTPDELSIILHFKGVPDPEVAPMIEAYLKQRHHALSHHLSPVPTAKHLFKLADAFRPHLTLDEDEDCKEDEDSENEDVFHDCLEYPRSRP